MPRKEKAYPDPAAYDILNAPGTGREVTGLIRIVRRYRPSSGTTSWLEPACGTGRYLRELARRGPSVVGFDASPDMIAYARRRQSRTARKATLFVARMESFEVPRPGGIDFALNLGNTIRHLGSDALLSAHLAAMARALKPRGLYLVGLSLERGESQVTEDAWSAARGRSRVDLLVQYLPEGRSEKVIQHWVVTRPGGIVHYDVGFLLRRFDSAQWSRVIERSPFREVGVFDLSGEPMPPGAFDYGVHLLERR